jgi:GntR family carbon starvation induced transcriptional regulator
MDAEGEDPRTLIEMTYERLRNDIIGGRLTPGTKLRVEHLKTRYEVSSGTLREALSLLVSEALVASEGRRGFHVAPMSLDDLEDITRTRVLIECEALRESMRHATPAWRSEVAAAFEQLSQAEARLGSGTSFELWEVRNEAFHDALVAACPSRWLRQFRAMLYQHSVRYRRLSAPIQPHAPAAAASRPAGAPVRAHQEHQAIFDAIMADDPQRATAALGWHIYLSITRIKALGLLS